MTAVCLHVAIAVAQEVSEVARTRAGGASSPKKLPRERPSGDLQGFERPCRVTSRTLVSRLTFSLPPPAPRERRSFFVFFSIFFLSRFEKLLMTNHVFSSARPAGGTRSNHWMECLRTATRFSPLNAGLLCSTFSFGPGFRLGCVVQPYNNSSPQQQQLK